MVSGAGVEAEAKVEVQGSRVGHALIGRLRFLMSARLGAATTYNPVRFQLGHSSRSFDKLFEVADVGDGTALTWVDTDVGSVSA